MADVERQQDLDRQRIVDTERSMLQLRLKLESQEGDIAYLQQQVMELEGWRERTLNARMHRGSSVIDLTGDGDSESEDDEIVIIPGLGEVVDPSIPNPLVRIEEEEVVVPPAPGEVCMPFF